VVCSLIFWCVIGKCSINFISSFLDNFANFIFVLTNLCKIFVCYFR
jgi:hypothetical protein